MKVRGLTTLKTEQDFAGFRHTKAFHSPSFRVRFVARLNQNIPRFGFIVPKKSFPKVTIRNQIKRRLKYFIQANFSNFKPLDILIAPNQGIVTKQYVEIERELATLFKQAHLWKKYPD